MNRNIRALLAALFAVLVVGMFLAPPSSGQDTKPVPLGISLTPESELWLEGGSTMHDWESRTHATKITLMGVAGTKMPATPAEFVELIRTSAVKSLSLAVPVATMESGKSGLDKKLWKTLKSDEHPTIDYHLTKYQFLNGSTDRDTMKVRAIGTLTVAGVERPDTLEASLYAGKEGVWLEGNHALRMTTFEIDPPKMMFGTLRTHDDFTVIFKLLMVPDKSMVGMQHDENNQEGAVK